MRLKGEGHYFGLLVAGYRLLLPQPSVYSTNYFLYQRALICSLGSFDADLSLINHHKWRVLGALSLLVQPEFAIMGHFDCCLRLVWRHRGFYGRLKLSLFGSS